MSKNDFSRKTKLPSAKPAAKPTNTAYPVRQQDLVAQQGRLNKAAAAGAAPLKSPPPAKTIELPASSQALPTKPLTPLASSWPSPLQPRGEAKPLQTKEPQVQKAPIAATPPKALPAVATPSVKPPVQATPPTAPGKPTLVAPTPKPAAPKTFNVSFVLVKREAKRASLCGDFNNWAADAAPMKQQGEGRWETAVALAPGRYQYKFLVDGEWIHDPSAKENVWNQHGTLNSVVEVRR